MEEISKCFKDPHETKERTQRNGVSMVKIIFIFGKTTEIGDAGKTVRREAFPEWHLNGKVGGERPFTHTVKGRACGT